MPTGWRGTRVTSTTVRKAAASRSAASCGATKGRRRWLGDSRGHWEGDTLVVDTTNFTDQTNFRGSRENLHVVERFTRVDDNTIRYEFTVDDATTWTKPWSAELPLVRDKGPIYEYA